MAKETFKKKRQPIEIFGFFEFDICVDEGPEELKHHQDVEFFPDVEEESGTWDRFGD